MLNSGVYFKPRDMLFVVYGKIGCKQTQQNYKTKPTFKGREIMANMFIALFNL